MIIHDVIQGNPEWFALRAGKPTASEFSKLVTSTGEVSKSLSGYAITLAGELYSGKPLDAWEGNSHTDRGKLLEGDARTMYAFLNDTELTQVGFVTDDEGLYGCSPDSLIGDDGGLEIKALKAENHIKAILYYRKHSRCPPDYIQQAQGNIMVCEREWWDVFFYHPDLPRLTVRINRSDSLITAMREQIKNVIAERDEILEELGQIIKG